MSSALAEEPIGQVAPHGMVRFTRQGEAAFDALAGHLASECGDTPEGIAKVLDRILEADISELADALATPKFPSTRCTPRPPTPRHAGGSASTPNRQRPAGVSRVDDRALTAGDCKDRGPGVGICPKCEP